MINFEVIDKLINLDENENILKINDIFYWKIYKKWIKYISLLILNIIKNI